MALKRSPLPTHLKVYVLCHDTADAGAVEARLLRVGMDLFQKNVAQDGSQTANARPGSAGSNKPKKNCGKKYFLRLKFTVGKSKQAVRTPNEVLKSFAVVRPDRPALDF